MQAYKTKLPSGYYMLFTASCFCEAKWEQKRLRGRYLKPFPVKDYLVMKQVNLRI